MEGVILFIIIKDGLHLYEFINCITWRENKSFLRKRMHRERHEKISKTDQELFSGEHILCEGKV